METINNTVKEACAKSKEVRKNEEREFQLRVAKIQTYADKCHALLSIRISFALVVFSLIVIFYPLYIQATLAGNPYSTTGLVGLVNSLWIISVAGIYLYKSGQKYNRNLKRISDMFEAVRKGKDLPPLELIHDWKANSSDPEKETTQV